MGGNERCHHKISKGDAMLEERFQEVYSKFKLHFYQETFARFQNREASLTTVETFAMETIYALGSPTVHEFAEFMRISSSNAAYKIASLIRKGYVRKVQSENDAREYHLCPTEKYLEYYNISSSYVHEVVERIKERFSAEELAALEKVLTVVSEELMPEVTVKLPQQEVDGWGRVHFNPFFQPAPPAHPMSQCKRAGHVLCDVSGSLCFWPYRFQRLTRAPSWPAVTKTPAYAPRADGRSPAWRGPLPQSSRHPRRLHAAPPRGQSPSRASPPPWSCSGRQGL